MIDSDSRIRNASRRVGLETPNATHQHRLRRQRLPRLELAGDDLPPEVGGDQLTRLGDPHYG